MADWCTLLGWLVAESNRRSSLILVSTADNKFVRVAGPVALAVIAPVFASN